MKKFTNKIAPVSIAALAILGLTAPGASAQTAQPDKSTETGPTYEITAADDRPGFELQVSDGAEVEVDQNNVAIISDDNGETLEELPASTTTEDGEPVEVVYTELSDDELLIQYQPNSSDETVGTMSVGSGCYWAAGSAVLSSAGLIAAIPTGGASLWLTYAGTVVSHGGAIQACA